MYVYNNNIKYNLFTNTIRGFSFLFEIIYKTHEKLLHSNDLLD